MFIAKHRIFTKHCGRPLSPLLADLTISGASISLHSHSNNSVHIDTRQLRGQAQLAANQLKYTHGTKQSLNFLWKLLLLFSFILFTAKAVKIVLNSPYALTWTSASYLALWTNNNVANSKIQPILKQYNAALPPLEPPNSSNLSPCSCACPICMIVDTDCTTFVVDTGANYIILNDKDMLQHFQQANGGVK